MNLDALLAGRGGASCSGVTCVLVSDDEPSWDRLRGLLANLQRAELGLATGGIVVLIEPRQPPWSWLQINEVGIAGDQISALWADQRAALLDRVRLEAWSFALDAVGFVPRTTEIESWARDWHSVGAEVVDMRTISSGRGPVREALSWVARRIGRGAA